jgi:hypothetical protein
MPTAAATTSGAAATATLERPAAETTAQATAQATAQQTVGQPTAASVTYAAQVPPTATTPAATPAAPAASSGPTPLIAWDSQGTSTTAPSRPGAAAAFGVPTATVGSGGRGFPWVKTIVILVLVAAIGAAVVLVGLPMYQARAAASAAGELAPVLAQSAPAKLGGQKVQKQRAAEAAALAATMRSEGAAWAWAGVYGNRADTSIYLAAELPAEARALAMQAQTDPEKAAELLAQVGAGMVAGSGGQLSVGAATEYGSEIGGTTWCRPITLGGVGGGHCLWTNGREVLQLVNYPSIEALAAKHTLAALRQLGGAPRSPAAG